MLIWTAGALNFSVSQALKIVEVLTRHEKSATCIPKLISSDGGLELVSVYLEN